MAARTNKVTLNEAWREKIRVSMLINRLQNHVLGKVKLTVTQLRAAEILLRKCAPDLMAVEHSGDVNVNTFAVPLTQAMEESPEWERRTVQ